MRKFPYRCSKCQSIFYGTRTLKENPCCEDANFQRLAVIHWVRKTKDRGRGTLVGSLLSGAQGDDTHHLPAQQPQRYKKGCPIRGGITTTVADLVTCYECKRSVDSMKAEADKSEPEPESEVDTSDDDGSDDDAPEKPT